MTAFMSHEERRRPLFPDPVLLGTLFGVMALGFLNLWSAASATGVPIQWKQALWYGLGLSVMWVIYRLEPRHIYDSTPWLYALGCLLLVVVLFTGKIGGGARRWISLGFFNLQPSELMKLFVVLQVSRHLSEERGGPLGFGALIVPLLYALVPAALVALEPDLGTAVLIVIIAGSIVLFVGLHWRTVIVLSTTGLLSLPLVWELMRPYQRRRVWVFLHPEADPAGAGYHIIQSKIAVGSGGLLGKGFGHGTQAHLNFLPEVHTDFAFSLWGEEWGFVGCALLVALYGVIVFRALGAAGEARERFAGLAAFGAGAMVFWQAFINMGMVIGLAPVVGVPLPLFSYGGSSVIVTLMAAGVILNAERRRRFFKDE